jgi:hypothetical protein
VRKENGELKSSIELIKKECGEIKKENVELKSSLERMEKENKVAVEENKVALDTIISLISSIKSS